ncbi:MAG TPA: hypothetical protein V6D48_04905 [Oculatellaceae cyanobacterium]
MKIVGFQLKHLLKVSPFALACVLFPLANLGTAQTLSPTQSSALSQELTQDTNGPWVPIVGGGLLMLATGAVVYAIRCRGRNRGSISGGGDTDSSYIAGGYSTGASGGDYSGSDYGSSSDCGDSSYSSSDSGGSSYSSGDSGGSSYSSSDSGGSSYSSSDSGGGSYSSSDSGGGSYSSGDSGGGGAGGGW